MTNLFLKSAYKQNCFVTQISLLSSSPSWGCIITLHLSPWLPWPRKSHGVNCLSIIDPEMKKLPPYCNTLATWCEKLTHLKRLMLGKIEGRRRRRRQRRRWLDGITDSMDRSFEQASGVGNGQGSPACCSPWGRKLSDMTEQLNWTERHLTLHLFSHL